jgi:GDP-L-fucose synthase
MKNDGPIDLATERILVTGGAGFLGRSVVERLRSRGAKDVFVPRRSEFDLTHEDGARRSFEAARPTVVIHLAAEVGGIGANRANPGRYFFANMAMALHCIETARQMAVRKFVQVGTICSYPKHAPVPFSEDALWDGYPEETNAPYGIAKKAAMVMLAGYGQQYGLRGACLLPVNLYGPWDNFDLETSHVIPAIIRKCVEAKRDGRPSIECWGTGSATREFLYVDDAAEAVVLAAERIDDPTPINLGTGREISVRDLVAMIARLVGMEGEVRWDPSRPDGQPRRCLDTRRAEQMLGWRADTDLESGLRRTVEWYVARA